MSQYEGYKSVYSDEALMCDWTSDAKDQNLPTVLAEAGFLIQDLLLDANVPVVRQQHTPSTFTESRSIQAPILVGDTILNIDIKQARLPNRHYFYLGYRAPMEGDNRYESVSYIWGVDAPEDQRLIRRQVEMVDNQEVPVPLEPGAKPTPVTNFSFDDMKTINLILKGVRDFDEAENG